MTDFLCPVCHNILSQKDKSMKCIKGHCFDISRKGTVNLLISNRSGHGDDKRMVNARKNFLDKGYYSPLKETVCRLITRYSGKGSTILDCGCGEGYYTAAVSESLSGAGISCEIIGIDVSKEAINRASARHAGIRLAEASVFGIPLVDKSCDIILALFSPFSGKEYLRVLKDKGVYITAFPLENHLFELKQAIYDKPYKNIVSPLETDGFMLEQYEECRFKVSLSSNKDIVSLFEMTPYCYKTSASDRAKLDILDRLEVTAEFGAAVYRKKLSYN